MFYSLLENSGQKFGFLVDKSKTVSYENYFSFRVISYTFENCSLKIDLVNDVAEHFGDFKIHSALGKIDSVRNILSNKLTAIYRLEPKDIADIWIICKNYSFVWREIFNEALEKETGLEPLEISNILTSFPSSYMDRIKWTGEIDYKKMQDDLHIIAGDIISGEENSLLV